MTITDPAHVATAKALRDQFQQRPASDPSDPMVDPMVRDLVDYDRAFGLIDAGPIEGEVA